MLNAVVLRPLPYKDSSRLVWLSNYLPRAKDTIAATPDFLAWRDQSHSFTSLAAYDEGDFNLTGGTVPERVHGVFVTASLFNVLEVHPEIGRALRSEENKQEHAPVVVLSNGFWRRRFGGDSSVLGKPVVLDGEATEIVGVMPASFIFPGNIVAPDVIVPLELPEHLDLTTQRVEVVQVIARLRPNATVGQARAEISLLSHQLVTGYPLGFRNMIAGMEARVVPLHEKLVGDVRRTLLVLLAAVVFLLIIACANTANLQLAKATGRSKN